MRKIIKRYPFPILMLVVLTIMAIWDRPHEAKAIEVLSFSIKEMLLVVPPIFILLGFLDIWIPKETMTRYMGEGSGIKGVALAFIVGSAAAGPLYGAFPIAAVFIRKGVSLFNVLIFIGAWSTTKIPMFLFELAALGPKFAWTRLAVDIPGIVIIAWVISRMIGLKEKKAIYNRVENL